MSLSIEVRRLDDMVVLELSGRLSIFEQNLRQLVRKLMERGDRNFLIDLANVSYLDLSGVGQLCMIYTMLHEGGGEMKLLRPTARIRKLLHITKLDTVFELLDDENDATGTTSTLQMSRFSMSANG
jgi:anti-sigma B factor antagonist